MADKALNGISFPGLEDTFVIPSATKVVKLWQNAAWSQTFTEQSVGLNTSEIYDAYVCTFVHSTHYGFEISVLINNYNAVQGRYGCARFAKGKVSSDYDEADETWRYVSIGANGNVAGFGNGYRNGSPDNNACVPLCVYGIKW